MSALLDRATQTLLASASRSAVTSSDDQGYASGRGAMIILDATVAPGVNASLELQLEVKDPVSDQYVPFTDFSPVTPNVSSTHSTFLFIVYPTEAGSYTAPNIQHLASSLPSFRWRAKVTPIGGSFTFSVSAVFMP